MMGAQIDRTMPRNDTSRRGRTQAMTRSGRWFSFLAALATLVLAAGAGRGRGGGRDPVVARDGRRARGVGQGPGGRLQQVPVGVPRQRRLQGQLHRGHDGRDRRVPRQAAAAHRPGLRGRDGDDDGREGCHQAGLRADGGRQREVRPEGLPAGGHRLLHDRRRPDAVAPAEQLDAGPLLQQGRLQEGRARPEQAAADVARDGRLREEAPGGGATLRLQQPSGSSGSCSRTTRPGTTCRSRPSRTASPASTPSSS